MYNTSNNFQQILLCMLNLFHHTFIFLDFTSISAPPIYSVYKTLTFSQLQIEKNSFFFMTNKLILTFNNHW